VLTPPSVFLLGASPLQVFRNHPFVDPGARWTDIQDGSGSTFQGTYGAVGSFQFS